MDKKHNSKVLNRIKSLKTAKHILMLLGEHWSVNKEKLL